LERFKDPGRASDSGGPSGCSKIRGIRRTRAQRTGPDSEGGDGSDGATIQHPPTATNLEWPGAGSLPFDDFDRIDATGGGTVLQPGQHGFDVVGFALEPGFDGTVGEVSDPADEVQVARARSRAPAKAYALHATADPDVSSGVVHAAGPAG
jgi:hypothetical protein